MHKKSERKFVITLKSSSVEISVINLTENPELLFAKKETLLGPEKLSPGNFVDKTIERLEKLIKENLSKILEQLKDSRDCEIIFHSPWFLPEIISQENKRTEISLKKFFIEKVKPPRQDDYRQIENKITNILLNGYNITQLKDIPSSDIEIDIFRSYISKSTLQKITSILNKNIIQIKNIEFSTSTMQAYETIKSLFISEDNNMFLIIGGEITEIGVVQNDVLTHTATFPIGTHEFSRELETFTSEKGDLNTLSFLSEKMTDEKLDEVKNKKIENVLDKWITEFKNTLKEQGIDLPKTVFLFSNSDTIDFLKMIFTDKKDLENINFIPIKRGIFDKKVINLENMTQNNVEYLLSTYYLSIKN